MYLQLEMHDREYKSPGYVARTHKQSLLDKCNAKIDVKSLQNTTVPLKIKIFT